MSECGSACKSVLGSIKPDLNEDGTVQNPTNLEKAKKVITIMGKKSARSILCTVWAHPGKIGDIDPEAYRHSEFERILKVWQLTTNFMIFGPIEWTEENKKPHFHLFAQWKSSKQFKTVLKVLYPGKYEVEPAMTTAEAIEYCWKENPDDVIMWGEMPKQGERTDLKKLIETNDFNVDRIANEHPDIYHRYKNGIDKKCELNAQLKNFDLFCDHEEVEVEYHLGSPRCGKTFNLRQQSKKFKADGVCVWLIQFINGEFWYVKGKSNLNENPEVLVINEFRDSNMRHTAFLELLEGIGSLACKGGKIECSGVKKILISSVIPPWELYTGAKKSEDIEAQIKGRISRLFYHDKIDGKYTCKQIAWREINDVAPDDEF